MLPAFGRRIKIGEANTAYDCFLPTLTEGECEVYACVHECVCVCVTVRVLVICLFNRPRATTAMRMRWEARRVYCVCVCVHNEISGKASVIIPQYSYIDCTCINPYIS